MIVLHSGTYALRAIRQPESAVHTSSFTVMCCLPVCSTMCDKQYYSYCSALKYRSDQRCLVGVLTTQHLLDDMLPTSRSTPGIPEAHLTLAEGHGARSLLCRGWMFG